MKLKELTTLLMTSIFWTICDGYRILGVFPFNGKSHFVMFEQLMKGLARRGHQVDVVSAFPLKEPYPNYTDIINFNSEDDVVLVNNLKIDFVKTMVRNSIVEFVASIAGNKVCRLLGDPNMQKLLNNPPTDPPYDLVIVEVFAAHCFMIVGHQLKIPVVSVTSSSLYPWHNAIVGNPDNAAIFSNTDLPYVGKLNFWQRLYNVVHIMLRKIEFNHITSEQNEIIRKYFGPDAPDVRDLEKSVALIITNSHYTLRGISPIMPAMVEAGGLHVQDDGSKPPPDLQRWMDESKDGFVYFSLGSMVKIESFPEETTRAFYKSFEKIAPIRVLIKIANPEELLSGIPKNVLTYPWLPQYHVLKHLNIKAFITHGGLMGTQEAVHLGVPMIAMPLFGDQFLNVNLYVNKNAAVLLNYEDITEEKLDQALNAVLKDPVYRESARALSAKFLDRPLNAMDTACYWVEYVIRHGNDALRSPLMDLAWWEQNLLDIYAVLLLATLVTVYLMMVLIKFLINFLFRKYQSKMAVKKKVT